VWEKKEQFVTGKTAVSGSLFFHYMRGEGHSVITGGGARAEVMGKKRPVSLFRGEEKSIDPLRLYWQSEKEGKASLFGGEES